jgi:hypothetical protein
MGEKAGRQLEGALHAWTSYRSLSLLRAADLLFHKSLHLLQLFAVPDT